MDDRESRVRGRMTHLRSLRPGQRLVLGQGVAAVVLTLVTLPFSYPSVGDPPPWVQLLGLLFLLGSAYASVYTWRIVLVCGLRPYDDARRDNPEARLRRHTRDERRLRLAAIICLLTIFILVPLPTSWHWFWFVLSVLGAIVAALSLLRLHRSQVAGR